jgi:two-component system osmolarity sensor histidine kinase EnvZ
MLKNLEKTLNSKGPKSLYSRFLLITILPVVLIQLITVYIFYERHWDSLSRNMTSSLNGEIALVVNSYYNLPESAKDAFLVSISDYLSFKITINKEQKISFFKNKNKEYSRLISGLKNVLNSKVAIFNAENDRLKVSVQVGNDVIDIVFSDKRIANPSTYIFLIWIVVSSILLLIISTLFLKGQVRSILNLSKAAERFGKGSELENFKPSGAKEIRAAGIAFIEMKERIKRLIDTRTQILAGVSHDLKTPLTRMKLQLSFLQDKENKDSLEHEVNEMNKMIDGYLNFARLETRDKFTETVSEVNLNKFISELVERYKNFPNKITVDIPENIYLHIRPEYFKRSLTNIVDNSIKYAKSLSVSALYENESVIINFDDDGAGIPEDKRELVFQPFYRLDESRNSETGGVGLGLSITKDIIHKHGGEIKLDISPLGGLRTTIILPK